MNLMAIFMTGFLVFAAFAFGIYADTQTTDLEKKHHAAMLMAVLLAIIVVLVAGLTKIIELLEAHQ
jgi:hypothetical protein